MIDKDPIIIIITPNNETPPLSSLFKFFDALLFYLVLPLVNF
jgi:hypothetical protein